MFTRRHYEAIAEVLQQRRERGKRTVDWGAYRNHMEWAGGSVVEQDLAMMFKEDNPRFNTDRFFLACGLED